MDSKVAILLEIKQTNKKPFSNLKCWNWCSERVICFPKVTWGIRLSWLCWDLSPFPFFLFFFFLRLHTNYRRTKVGRYTLSARERRITVHVFQGSDYIKVLEWAKNAGFKTNITACKTSNFNFCKTVSLDNTIPLMEQLLRACFSSL